MMLANKVALITGATRGIGQSGAFAFAREGAKVVVTGRDAGAGELTAREIRHQGGEAVFIPAELTSVKDTERMVKDAADAYGRIDILWHNAGVFINGHIEVIREEDYDEEFTISLKASVFATQFVLPFMKRAGGGCILYTSSMVALRPVPYDPQYSLTHPIAKSGLIMLMRSLVEPLAKYNIRVNCLCPGPVDTEAWIRGKKIQARAAGIPWEEFYKFLVRRQPLGRNLTMDEVINGAVFLVSDRASGITGVSLPVDAGFGAV